MPVLINEKIKAKKISDVAERKLIHLDQLMMAKIDFSNGPMKEPEPPHSHPHEQITYVAAGEIVIFIGEEQHRLREGDMFAVPGNVPHCLQTLTEKVTLIDSFTPLRNEFL